MQFRMKSSGIAACCLAACLWSGGAGANSRVLLFDAYLDDRPIGQHRYVLREEDAGLRVDSTADFRVKALFITAYRYRHENREWWRDGCLRAIDARTDSNGWESRVLGSERDGGFQLERPPSSTLDGCIRSFAYWDPQLLRADRLLNSQTGDHQPVVLRPQPSGRLRIGTADIDVRRYALQGKGLDITLAYAADSGEWLGLDSRVEGGRTLSYRRSPTSLGASTNTLAR